MLRSRSPEKPKVQKTIAFKKEQKDTENYIQKLKKKQVKLLSATNKVDDIKKKEISNNLLSLKEIKICKNIKNRNNWKRNFPNSVDSLYCFTKIENLGKKMEVRHVWYYENQIMTQVRYNVKSLMFIVLGQKNYLIFPNRELEVEVQDRNGIIGSKI